MTESAARPGVFVPRMQAIPPDAPAIRVNNVSPEEAEAQAVIDNDVKLAHQEWEQGGRQPLFNKSPRKYYEIPGDDPELLAKTIKQLNNAARLLPGVRVKIAKPVQLVQNENGEIVWLLVWVAKERNPRPSTVARREAAAAAAPAPARRAAPQPAQTWNPTFRAPVGSLRDEPP